MKIQLLFVIIFLSISNIFALSDEYKIQTKKQAYETAIRVTGFEKETFPIDSLILNEIVLDTIFDENIPFWVPEDSGTLVWVVTFDEFKYASEKINKKTYKVYLIAKTKQLIKITGQEDVTKEFFMDKISKESHKKGIHSVDLEEWIKFSDSVQGCSFLWALPKAIPRLFAAKEIYAVQVYSTWLYKEPRLVWVIKGFDMPCNKNNRFSFCNAVVHFDGMHGGGLRTASF